MLGRSHAANVQQSVKEAPGRQARIKLDIASGPAILLIPESSHADRLVVANIGEIMFVHLITFSQK